MSAHLDRARLQALLLGGLTPEEERALAAHLAAGCDTCEAALAELPAEDEAALIGLLARAEAAPAARLPAEAVERALSRPAWWRLAWLAPVAAVALGLLAWLWLPAPPAPPGPGQRIKGPGGVPEIGLALGVVVRGGQGEAQITRLGADARLPQDRTLVFQITLRERCHLGLARLGPDGAIAPLLPEPPGAPLELGPGVHTPTAGGVPGAASLGLPLAGLRGRQVFVATCSARPLDLPAALAPLARALAAGAEPDSGTLPFGHALAAVEVLGGDP